MKPAYLTATVRVGGRKLTAEYRLHRGRKAPHYGADHPDFMAPGQPDRVEVVRVLMGRVDVTETLEQDSLLAIEYQIINQMRAEGGALVSPARSKHHPAGPVSFHHEAALRIGERVLANRERRVRDDRDQRRLDV